MFFTSKKVQASAVMNKRFIEVEIGTKFVDAVNTMLKNNLGEFFVVNGAGDATGVVTLKDVSRIMNEEGYEKLTVEEIISGEMITISGVMPLIRCRDIMLKKKIGRLPVVEEGHLVGVIRTSEIRDHFYMKMEEFNIKLNQIINSLHEAVCVIDQNGEVVIWNKNAERLYGVASDDIIDHPLEAFFPEAKLLDVLKSKKSVDNVYHSPRKGSHIAISVNPIYIEGKFLGVVSTDRDISEVKDLSEKLMEATNTLQFLEHEVQRISSDGFGKIIGKSRELVKSIEIAKQVSRTDASILIHGESGTGKEVFARAIHTQSGKKGLFVPVNCSAIPDELFESEFFGYDAGAFTGANKKGKLGIFELASDGTVFLDEIGELPMHMQAKLLRVLQEKEIRRVGGEKIISINVRVISATNKDLAQMVEDGTFREDLYYRLNVVNVNLPPLRKRQGDIDLFINHFFNEICKANDMPLPKISTEVMQALRNYCWRGNVRELKNTIEHIVVLCKDGLVTMDLVPQYIVDAVKRRMVENGGDDEKDINKAVAALEKKLILEALNATGFNKAKAAKVLNIKRSTLYYKIDYYNITQESSGK